MKDKIINLLNSVDLTGNFFKNVIKSFSNIFKEIIKIIKSAKNNVKRTIIKYIPEIIECMKKLLCKKIPIISSILEYITGSSITFMDIICVILSFEINVVL